MTDRQGPISPPLVARAKAGHDDALRDLAESAYPLVRRWALVFMGDPSDAADLAQDVMVKLMGRLDAFDGAARFETWLYAFTRNAAHDRRRRALRIDRTKFDLRSLEAFTPAPAPDPAREAERSRLRALLTELFRELPDRQREVFDLVELQGLSSAEAAEIMDVEAVSVRAHLFKARARLRALMLERHPAIAEEVAP